MGIRYLRLGLVPLLTVALLSTQLLLPARAVGGSGNGNGEPSPPPQQGRVNIVIGAAVVIAALGLVWWFTRGEKEAEDEESEEPGTKAQTLGGEKAEMSLIEVGELRLSRGENSAPVLSGTEPTSSLPCCIESE